MDFSQALNFVNRHSTERQGKVPSNKIHLHLGKEIIAELYVLLILFTHRARSFFLIHIYVTKRRKSSLPL